MRGVSLLSPNLSNSSTLTEEFKPNVVFEGLEAFRTDQGGTRCWSGQGRTNLSLQLLVALRQPQYCPAHACHLVVQALAQRTLLRKPVCVWTRTTCVTAEKQGRN